MDRNFSPFLALPLWQADGQGLAKDLMLCTNAVLKFCTFRLHFVDDKIFGIKDDSFCSSGLDLNFVQSKAAQSLLFKIHQP
eukprot:CAMPEP_0206417634 /NCGR_PEP_ID=MMETSP0294-20121207/37442_1 /ASSEMBLY_ACC=CAM_ASM_000327 /TAXON_ID=39354 /ORGANISM="Heterosigma akashiwo, Strain CCMP2393" /LENGTH=80 /DNA_ID=CAMNT_0053880483 /DNA_START=197 /DNA_END=435 /DNA_ORIENTATION=-